MCHTQARAMHTEATEQNRLLTHIDTDLTKTMSSIEGSTQDASRANAQSRKGYCWMYVVIGVELYILFMILLKYS